MTKFKEKFFIETNLSLVNKITLAGLFIALAIIFNKIIAINAISFIPFLRISFGGCAVIILASLLLGPLFGGVVGVFSDVFGYLIFDMSAYGYFPQITLIYLLLGVLPSFIFGLIKNMKSKSLLLSLECILMSLLLIGLSLYLGLNNEVTIFGSTYSISLWMKIVLPLVAFILFGLIILITVLIDRHFAKLESKNIPLNTYQISFGCFISELVVMVGFGAYIKALCFGLSMYLLILACQSLVMFFDVALNTFIISYVLVIFKRYYPAKVAVNS
ncbi:MAG: hypothetical protein LUD22_02790 [Coprobacillus sp.]|nr:hypothetical protein [Coprobacillus sp.]